MSSRFLACERKYGIACGSATMSPAVPPTMARVGNQWRPFANCVGNVAKYLSDPGQSLLVETAKTLLVPMVSRCHLSKIGISAMDYQANCRRRLAQRPIWKDRKCPH